MSSEDDGAGTQHVYSDTYSDGTYQYRHVKLARRVHLRRLLTEEEWRGLGVCQSRGWQHYGGHAPEPRMLLFRRPLGTDPVTGKVCPARAAAAKAAFAKEYGLQQAPAAEPAAAAAPAAAAKPAAADGAGASAAP